MVDEADDFLRDGVAGGRLARENERARNHVVVRIVDQTVVHDNDVQREHQLPFVFMDSLHLHVEQRIRIDADASRLADDFRQILFVRLFDGAELLKKRVIIQKFFQLTQL